MSRINHIIFLAGVLFFVFFFSFFQSSQAGFFDWFKKNNSQSSQSITAVASSAKQYTLSVSKSGSGVVISDDGKINCGKQCKASYPANSKIVLKAEAGNNYKFERWNGCDKVLDGKCQTTLNKSKMIVVKFDSKRTNSFSSQKSSSLSARKASSSKYSSSKSSSASSKADSSKALSSSSSSKNSSSVSNSSSSSFVFSSSISSSLNSNELDKNVFVVEDDGTLISPQYQVRPLEVAKKFYNLNPDKKDSYDLLTLFTSFHDPNTVEYHMGLRNNISGIGRVPTMSSNDIADLPSKLVGISFVNDTYSPKYNTVEAEIKNNLFLMNHETGHQWLTYIGKDEGISDDVHYSKWVSNGFIRDGIQWGDVMQGWPWKDNGDGTVSVKNITHAGFSNISLYMMGLISASEVPDLQIVVPKDPASKDLNNVPGTFKTIQIKDLIAKYGERAPSYLNSQKDFNMAYILVVKGSQTQSDYEPILNVVSWVAKYFPDEWNYITYGKSTINKGL